jgi:ABC-2 type transport system permease protein
MNKIFLIIKREYVTRVRKRSFIIMTILGPILMAAMFVVPAYLATRQQETRTISIVDESGWFAQKFRNSDNFKFEVLGMSLESAKEAMKDVKDYAILYIPKTELTIPDKAMIYCDKQPSIMMKEYISWVMEREIEKQKLASEIRLQMAKSDPNYNPGKDSLTNSLLSEQILKNIKTSVQLNTITIEAGGKEKKSFTESSMMVGLFAGIMIYMFIFMFGVQVMRGVIEEKTNRIVEVIVSSVKPFQLMMGKIIGIALVGLTQFLLWIVFTLLIVTAFQQAFPDKFKINSTPKQEMVSASTTNGNQVAKSGPEVRTADASVNPFLEGLYSIRYDIMILSFIFYFLGGYLLYAALFAAVGSAVDNETDTQQFMLPVTVPLILSIMLAQAVIMNPNGPLAFWMSIIPLTSPIIMLIRIPFGVPWSELALSAGLLIIAFLGATWLAAKIYRTGILMYGKKVSYGELWKWIWFKG